MHELGMCEAIMDTVERRAAGRGVEHVKLRVGVLHRVEPSAFDQAFEMVAMGTVAEGATVQLVSIPVRVTCADCYHEAECEGPEAACRNCGSVRVEVVGGDDLTLESLRFIPETAAQE